MRGPGRRRATESLAPDWRPPPPTPTPTPNNTGDPLQNFSSPVPGRESDASFCSSRHSIASIPNISDRSYQKSALRIINSFLASQSAPFSLKHPLPSAKDITETLKLLLQRFDFVSRKIDEDFSLVLKSFKCPLKLNKSALRAPGTPHSWPNLLAVIHWLVQLVQYGNSSPDLESVDETANELDAKLALKNGPSQKEVLEQEKAVVEKDVMKFHDMIEQLDAHLVDVQKKLEEKERALEAKVEEWKRICNENEELKRKIEEQGINLRDAERMKRELQAVDRDFEEKEAGRSVWEEKIWELDSEIAHKFKELEPLEMECNQAIRRLKLGNGFQYKLNADGSTPSELLGLDYKLMLMPAFTSFGEEIKVSKMGKLEERISFQQRSGENAAKLNDRRNHIAVVISHIDEVETQLDIMRKEMHKYLSRRSAEGKKLAEEIELEVQHISAVEKTAAELLKTSKAWLHEDIIQIEEDVKMCAQVLIDLINSVSSYKEYVGSKIKFAVIF
ncbi:hypothetical protein C2S52_006216 [Perilla frutescens var. hirtella]|nr:hypothetical protein C2S51_009590 [Perilla frutescens var. frutescens]KAH6786664.1 hypothetical protein C2S52_006216 [Perilla frutescens var. hirtella]